MYMYVCVYLLYISELTEQVQFLWICVGIPLLLLPHSNIYPYGQYTYLCRCFVLICGGDQQLNFALTISSHFLHLHSIHIRCTRMHVYNLCCPLDGLMQWGHIKGGTQFVCLASGTNALVICISCIFHKHVFNNFRHLVDPKGHPAILTVEWLYLHLAAIIRLPDT